MERSLQGPDGSLQDVSVHITADVVLDEGLRLPDDLHHELQGLISPAALAPPEESSVLADVLVAVLHGAEDGAVEGPELGGV